MASYEGQITLINIDDGVGTPGAPGPTYVIYTNQDEILRFADVGTGFSFSPNELNIQVRKSTEDTSELQDIDLNNFLFYWYLNNSWTLAGQEELENYVQISGDHKTITLDILGMANSTDDKITHLRNALLNEETAIKFEYYFNQALTEVKVIGVRYGLSADMARLALNANGIVASIQEAGLIFNANGLTVKNGAFTMITDIFTPVEIVDFEDGEDYYIKTVNGYEIVDKNAGVTAGVQYFKRETTESLKANENGDLTLTGIVNAKDGQFEGTVYAKDGRFNGEINATGGSFSNSIQVLGQLIVGDENKIYVGAFEEEGLQGIFSSNYLENEEKGFCFQTDGSIIANTIELGDFATIRNFLRIGNNCYLYNPLTQAGRFISVQDANGKEIISLREDGILKIGEEDSEKGTGGICINGKKSSIYTNGFIPGSSVGWSISSEEAEFNNVVVRGTIKSSVLSYGNVQTVGGILLVRPSTIIKKYSELSGGGYDIYPETKNAGFVIGEFCQIGNQGTLYQIENIYQDETEGEVIRLKKAVVATTLEEPVSLNQEDETKFSIIGEILVSYGMENDSIGIAINSSDNSAAVPPHAISVFKSDFVSDENGNIKLEKTPVIILGEISDIKYGGLQGYGLYADNAYLKGSLISEGTIQGKKFYSGINTQSNIHMPASEAGLEFFPGREKGNILFWAGAASSEEADIEVAPFKVDSFGNLYAGSGFFNGTIISNATITAARIKAAVIEGWSLDMNAPAALSIVDVEKAINFSRRIKDGEVESLEEIMTVDSNKMKLSVPLEIGQYNNEREFIPRITINPEDGSLQIEKFIVERANGDKAEVDTSSLTFLKYLGNSSNLVKTVIKAEYGTSPNLQFHVMNENQAESTESQILRLTKERSSLYNELQCSSGLLLGDVMEYKPVLNEQNTVIGYDLYVKE